MPLDEPDLTGQIAFPGDPLVVGFGRERSNQTQARRFVRKNPYHPGPPSNLFIEPFQHVRRFHPTPMATRQPIHRERLFDVFPQPRVTSFSRTPGSSPQRATQACNATRAWSACS